MFSCHSAVVAGASGILKNLIKQHIDETQSSDEIVIILAETDVSLVHQFINEAYRFTPGSGEFLIRKILMGNLGNNIKNMGRKGVKVEGSEKCEIKMEQKFQDIECDEGG